MATTTRLISPIRNSVLSWFTSLFQRARGAWTMMIGTREVLPDMTQQRAIDLGFDANAAVYSIAKKDADKFASIPRYVYEAESMEAKKKRKMPLHLKEVSGAKTLKNDLSKLLGRPNPYQGQAAFFKTVRAYYKVCGESFIWLNRGDVGDLNDLAQDREPVLEMYPLPVDQVSIVPDPENWYGIAGYILKVGGLDYPIRKNDVIHWKDINLKWDATSKEHLRGMSALKPGAAILQQNNDATLGATRMYQNDGAKGVLYGEETKGVTPTQESQIRGVVDRKVNNNDIKGAVASIFGAGKLGYLDLGGTSVDLELLKGKQMTWQELCALLAVPYELFQSETTFANKAQAQEGWVSNDIMPACKELDDELNRQLLKAFGLVDIAVIASDFSELSELQENMKELAEWLVMAWWITPNEKREIMGYEKDPNPLMDEQWVSASIIPISQAGAVDDGFDALATDIGLSDYSVPAKTPATTPSKNGTKTPVA